MKNVFILLCMILTFVTYAKAEQVEIDLGSGYENEVWYDFINGVVKSEPMDNWDIAFEVTATNAGIRINEPKGVQLWAVPESNEEDFGSPVDTTGLDADWTLLHNSVESWSIGAFNMGLNGFETDGDFGWGVYNMLEHGVTGNKIFVLKLADKSYKTILIEKLVGGKFTIRWAELDGSDEQSAIITKSDFPNRNLVYLSFETGELIDREPPLDEWALVFGKYIELIDAGDVMMPYAVTGARTNPAYRTAQIDGTAPSEATAPEYNTKNYSKNITEIGSDWKQINNSTFEYNIVENRTYFISKSDTLDENPIIDKIYFTDFEGSSTGKLTFTQNDGETSVSDTPSFTTVDIYPTIVSPHDTINIILPDSSQNVKIIIYGINGDAVFKQVFKQFGSNKFDFLSPDVPAGTYLIKVFTDYAVYSGKILIK